MTKFYQQDENAPNAIVSYYTKGALLAFVLDIEIRKRTNDQYTLDDVLRLIWNNYQATGLKDNTAQQVVEYLTQSDFNSFFDQYLYGVDDLPLKQAFEYIGINCKFKHKKNDLSKFGFAINKTQKHAIISHIFDNTCAQTSGLYVGDKIVSINGEEISATALVKTMDDYSEGKCIKIDIVRDELPCEILLTIIYNEKIHAILTLNEQANKATLKRQKQWLKG